MVEENMFINAAILISTGIVRMFINKYSTVSASTHAIQQSEPIVYISVHVIPQIDHQER